MILDLYAVLLGHNHPNVPAVTSPYSSPSNASFAATDHGFAIQIEADICPTP